MAASSIVGCSGGDTDLSATAEELGWQNVKLVIVNHGVDAESVIDQGKCYVFIEMPTEQELHVNDHPSTSHTFYHIGDSIERCLAGTAQKANPLLLNIGEVLLDHSINIDYVPHPQECGPESAQFLGCYIAWASLIVLNDTVISDSLSADYPYTLWSRQIIGHEIWHMYAGPFHSGYY